MEISYMGEIKLLDCTLRDGGYVNDWKFGHNNMVSIFERLVDANVDYIEIGFLDERRPFDINRSIMPDTDCVQKIFGNLDRKNSLIVGMIDYGTCSLAHIKPCEESYLDAIRVIFKKHLRNEAMSFCAELKKLGYKVFAQLVSVTSYTDDEMMDLIRLANEVKPYAVSMVDTYGLMHQNNLKHYFDLLDQYLLPEIGLGYHAHNNFQMGYANCITMMSQVTDRLLLVDGTIYGMGKSAGNAPIELIAMYMNSNLGKNYDISQFLEAIDANITSFYTPATWGYNMFFYLAASNDCHPTYVSDLMKKKTLSVKQINELLGRLQGDKKLLYDKKYMEQLYLEYQENDIDDTLDVQALKELFGSRKLLLLGTGDSVTEQEELLKNFINENNPIVISMNYIPDNISPDMIFLSNSKKYVQIASKLSRHQGEYKIIATSNVTKTSGAFDYTVRYKDVLDTEENAIPDVAFAVLLKTMEKVGVKEVYLAGIDGFNETHNGIYLDDEERCDYGIKHTDELNEYVNQMMQRMNKTIKMNLLTKSIYTL
jgi:hypothetical protein